MKFSNCKLCSEKKSRPGGMLFLRQHGRCKYKLKTIVTDCTKSTWKGCEVPPLAKDRC